MNKKIIVTIMLTVFVKNLLCDTSLSTCTRAFNKDIYYNHDANYYNTVFIPPKCSDPKMVGAYLTSQSALQKQAKKLISLSSTRKKITEAVPAKDLEKVANSEILLSILKTKKYSSEDIFTKERSAGVSVFKCLREFRKAKSEISGVPSQCLLHLESIRTYLKEDSVPENIASKLIESLPVQTIVPYDDLKKIHSPQVLKLLIRTGAYKESFIKDGGYQKLAREFDLAGYHDMSRELRGDKDGYPEDLVKDAVLMASYGTACVLVPPFLVLREVLGMIFDR